MLIVKHAAEHDGTIAVRRPRGKKSGGLNRRKPGRLFDLPAQAKVLAGAQWTATAFKAYLRDNVFEFRSRHDLLWTKQSLEIHSKALNTTISLERELKSVVFHVHDMYLPHSIEFELFFLCRRMVRTDPNIKFFRHFMKESRSLEHVTWLLEKFETGFPRFTLTAAAHHLDGILEELQDYGLESFQVMPARPAKMADHQMFLEKVNGMIEQKIQQQTTTEE